MTQSWHLKTLLWVEALVIGACLLLSVLVWLAPIPDILQRPIESLSIRDMLPPSQKEFGEGKAVQFDAALNSPLFRSSRKPFEPAKQRIEPQPEVALPEPHLLPTPPVAQNSDWHQLILKGLIIDPNGQKALISSPGNQVGEWYNIGAVIGGWRIETITKDKIGLHSGELSVDLPLYVDNHTKIIGTPNTAE